MSRRPLLEPPPRNAATTDKPLGVTERYEAQPFAGGWELGSLSVREQGYPTSVMRNQRKSNEAVTKDEAGSGAQIVRSGSKRWRPLRNASRPCRMARRSRRLLEEGTSGAVIGAFLNVHAALGFGYRELIYNLALERELRAAGHQVDRELAVMVYYRGEPLARQILDMVVDRKVIVESKASEILPPGADRQLFSYLCSTMLEVGLVLHFGREPHYHRVICENRFKRFSR